MQQFLQMMTKLFLLILHAGNEDDSVFRKLADCFTDGYHGEWAGFYNQGYPASSQHRHMFWHVKYRVTMAPHQNHWYCNTDDQLMAEYIARHKDQLPLQELEELKNTCEYGCSDPRLHPRHEEHSEEAAKEAERRLDDDFFSLTQVLACYMQDHKVLPYCTVLQCLASRYLGGGLLDPTFTDEEHPYRSSPQFSLMFWYLGNWCRKRFDKSPLPERLRKFAPHIDYDIDHEHNPIGDDKPQFNNYFTNVIKNLGAHLFMNCEAGSIYPYRKRLEEAKITTCFNDYHDLMVAARIGKGGSIRQIAGYNTSEDDTRIWCVSWAIFEANWGKTKHRDTQEIEDLSRARMTMTRVCVCVCYVGHKHVGDSPGITGESITCMAFECAIYQVDVIPGDGNNACYCSTPKSPGVPTYDNSRLQYWINKMMNVATQARNKHFGVCPPVGVKHFISCSYRDLDFLATHLGGITTEAHTMDLANKTHGYGDCCMMSIFEWGHARLEYSEDITQFDDQDHMDYIGEFTFRVNETCLSSDHNIFMVAPTDNDAHNPILVHLKPADMPRGERYKYIPFEMKKRRKEKRKAVQKANKMKGWEDYDNDESTWQDWSDWPR